MRAETFGLSGRNHYAHDRNPPYWEAAPGAVDALWIRQSVGEKLASVDKKLRAQGLCLYLYDAWRPRAVQAYFHEVWTPRELARRHPDWSDAQVREEVGNYWAAPTNDPMRPAPHATGAAVDLTIAIIGEGPLWMGSLFDDVTPLAHTDRFEHGDAASFAFSDEEARANRRLLFWLMIEAGFNNYRNEWWHYSWGDQMWARDTGQPAALYGLAPDP